MKRLLHIPRYRSVVLVALAVLWAAFMMIGAPVVIADKGGKGKPQDTSGTTTPTGDTTSGGGDTSGGDTSSSGDTSSGDTSGTTPTGDINEDTSGENGLLYTDEELCQMFGPRFCPDLARDAGWDYMDYFVYCYARGLWPGDECPDPMGGHS